MFLLGATAVLGLVLYGRVYLQYHTVNQVYVGCLVGVTFACIWFFLNQKLFTPHIFPWLVRSWIGRLFMMHDLTNVRGFAAALQGMMVGLERRAERNREHLS